MSTISETIRRLFGYAKNYTPDELLNTKFRNILCIRKTKLTFIIMYYFVNLLLNEKDYYNLDYNYKVCIVLRVIQTVSYITFIMLCTMKYKWAKHEETIRIGAFCFILEFFIKMYLLLVPVISDSNLLNYYKFKDALNIDDTVTYLYNMYIHDEKLFKYLGKLLSLFIPNLLITTTILQVLQYLTNSFKNQPFILLYSNSDNNKTLVNKYDQLRKIFTVPYCTIQIFIYSLSIQIVSLIPDIKNIAIPVLIIMLCSSLIYAVYWPYLKWYILLILYLLWMTPIIYLISNYEIFQELYSFIMSIFNQSFVIMILLHDFIIYLFDPCDTPTEYIVVF